MRKRQRQDDREQEREYEKEEGEADLYQLLAYHMAWLMLKGPREHSLVFKRN